MEEIINGKEECPNAIFHKQSGKRILITGAGGFLASRLIKYYSGNYDIIGLNHKELDFTDYEKARECFEKFHPNIAIHCGAISDVGACDINPEYSYQVNVHGAENIARACAEYGTKLIFCSSDQVYFGSSEKKPHKESEILTPPHAYGKQKLEAEKRCMECNANTVALRLSWMYDWKKESENEHGNLMTTIAEAIKTGQVMKYPVHDYRSITNVWEVIKNLEKAFLIPSGIYNFGSPNECNTYELVKCVLEQMKKDVNLVVENTEAFTDNPRNLRMDQEKINGQSIVFLDTLKGIKATIE